MKKISRQQAEEIYAMWEARAERLGNVTTEKGVFYQKRARRIRHRMLDRIYMLEDVIHPLKKSGFIEGWEIVD